MLIDHLNNFNTFEFIDLVITSSQTKTLRLLVIYRPQTDTSGHTTSADFLDEFSTFMENFAPIKSNLLITGDFNYHYDATNCEYSNRFKDIIESLNFKQHISKSTHTKGHTLDLIITRSSDNFILDSSIETHHHLPSDHAAITCSLSIFKPPPVKIDITFREINKININEFKNDILNSSLCNNSLTNIDDLVFYYDKILRDLLDQHAPVIHRRITARPQSPWYNNELREKKQELRRLERQWLKSKLIIHHQLFRRCSNEYAIMIRSAKCSYHTNQLANSNSKQLFSRITKLTSPNSAGILPSSYSSSALANRFQNYFTNKITDIKNNLLHDNSINDNSVNACNSSFSTFSEVSISAVKTIILNSSSASCDLDPIPTSLLKQCIIELSPVITNIVNRSLCSGYFPDCLKISHITPIIKKPNLDSEILNNYRPVANIKFLAKTIERAASIQIQNYLSSNNLHSKFQSAYKANHSTETALLRVSNDLLLNLDNGDEAILILLDYSAAFDTINHKVLLHRLSTRFGLNGDSLNWFESYFRNRVQFIKIKKFSPFHTHPKKVSHKDQLLDPLLLFCILRLLRKLLIHLTYLK